MAPLTDALTLRAYANALANWRFEGYVVWTGVALRWVRRELEGHTMQSIARAMHEYVARGGVIDQVVETRAGWAEHRYHYDLRLEFEGRPIYVETRLLFEDPNDPDDPRIHVVNIHDQ